MSLPSGRMLTQHVHGPGFLPQNHTTTNQSHTREGCFEGKELRAGRMQCWVNWGTQWWLTNRSRNGVENLFPQLSKPRFPVYLSDAHQLCLRAGTSIFTLKEVLVQLRMPQPVTRRWGTTKQVVHTSPCFCEFSARLVLRFPRRRRFQPEGEESGYNGGLHLMLRGRA